MDSEHDAVVRQLAEILVSKALQYLARTGFLSGTATAPQPYIDIAGNDSKLIQSELLAGASIDLDGAAFITVRSGLNLGRPDLIAQVMAHEDSAPHSFSTQGSVVE